MNLTEMTMNELAGYSYHCGCSKTHTVDIKKVVIKERAISDTVRYINEYTKGTVMMLCDENTYQVAGREIESRLNHVQKYIIQERNNLPVIPDESIIGEILIKIPKEVDLFLAVGSGVINDITRQISYKMNKEYVVFGTAPSMDGYASVTSSLIINYVKESIQGQCPIAIFADMEILRNAPYDMITAGFGDVIGKYNAIREWQFARDLHQEHYCETMASLMMDAVKKCEKNAVYLQKREKKAVAAVMEALLLAGMTMGMYQNTRPASGAEHHIVHYWDVDCIRKKIEHPLHGNSVGVGTVIICRLYDLVKDLLPVKVMPLEVEKMEMILKSAGCKTSPVELNISRELLKESILFGHTMSSKFTILTYLSKENPTVLEKVAEEICCYYY